MAVGRLFSGFFGGGNRLQRRVPPTTEAGTSGAFETGGYLESTERQSEVRGKQRYQTFGNLLANVAIVAAGTRGFLNLMAQSTWTVAPADTDNEVDAARAQEAADLVDDILHDMQRPWSRIVRRSGMYRFYGFSIQEWTAKRRQDGSIGLLDVAPRPQATIERWALDDAGNVEGLTQLNPKTQQEVFLPRAKVVHIVDDALSDSPEGLGLFRHLVESNQRLQRYQLLEAFGFETDLKGIPIGRAPYGKLREMVANGDIDDAQKQQILQPMEDFIRKHIKSPELGLALDSQPYRGTGDNEAPSATLEWDVKLLQGSPTSATAVAAAIERITRDMAIVLGVQGLLLGGDGSGSLALGKSFAEQFALMVNSALGEVAEAYEHDLVPVVMRLNGIDEALEPTLRPSDVHHRDVDQITRGLRDLSDAGAVMPPDDPAINVVRAMLGVPEQDVDAMALDSLLERPTPPPVPPEPPEPPDPDDPIDDDDDEPV
jgi:hypothetical protein